ncbi:MAG: winged helix-turn-helix transcriptional regulator [Chloroflexi bacterium]|nr:MAG: winged helix-turn-helix transcriptional regulator [Chloroflexota bacterium]TME15485.1 MAG: winged helix-turn-helix transcriptional regulator [Chloroflexota bacterium]TME16559.1 MAG: winged helix-turn-helix transcriptional regulator [Chloroflexota bacterium]
MEPESIPAFVGIEGEDTGTRDAETALHWLRIYSELVALESERRGRLAAGAPDPIAGRERWDRLEARRLYWETRHNQLRGLQLDLRTRQLLFGGKSIPVSRREAQLLAFLLANPGRSFTTAVLLQEAWGEPRLSAEQIRIYVSHLRRKLLEVGALAAIVHRRRLGYSLEFN